MFTVLKPLNKRKINADQVVDRLRKKLAKVEGINLYLQVVQDVRVGGHSSRTQYQYTIQDADIDELNRWAPKLLDTLKNAARSLKDVASDQQAGGLQESLVVDRDSAHRLGVTSQVIDDTLYDAFGQRQVSTIFTQLNLYRVILEVAPEFQQQPAGARPDLYLRIRDGRARFRCRSFAHYER